jgi:hypothetical protein
MMFGQRVCRYDPIALVAICALGVGSLRAGDRRAASDNEPDHVRQVADLHASSQSLVRGVLLAGGASPGDAARHERAFRAFAQRLRDRGTVAGDARRRARAIHEFMHAEMLRGAYDSAASDLAATLDGGAFNCASASAVFLALAREFELEAQAVSVVGHVWCRVNCREGPFDVETTCRDWFPLAEHRDTPQAAPSRHWEDHVRRAASARVLDEPAFLAVFHYNRGVRLLREGRFAAAAAANIAALTLDAGCQPAYANLAAAVNGWSLQAVSKPHRRGGQSRFSPRAPKNWDSPRRF